MDRLWEYCLKLGQFFGQSAELVNESAIASILPDNRIGGRGRQADGICVAQSFAPVAGLPMICHVLDTAISVEGAKRAVVVGNQAELAVQVIAGHDSSASIHVQLERKGTAHAVLAAREAITNGLDDVIILNGDVPLVRNETIMAARQTLADGADMVVLGFDSPNPAGYGRMITQGNKLLSIREEKDASDEEKRITFCNSGIIAFNASHLVRILEEIGNDNAQGEFYLTDAAGIGSSRGLQVIAMEVPEEETLGVNDRVQLAQVEALWQTRKRNELMAAGVTMTSPHTVIFHHDTDVDSDTVLEPNIVFGPKVRVGSGAVIRAFSHLEGATIGERAIVGPFARLRPGARLETDTKIGNFVEIKSTTIGQGAKVSHLSYVGDSEIGAGANVGAGAITCNYDGFNKHKTLIGEGAFIGTNTSLVAPVKVGRNANTAAGSVIYEDVPDEDLAIERSKQANLSGKARQLRDKYAKSKAKKKNSP